MQTVIRISLCVMALSTLPTAKAAELSPWLGSADQLPFQLDPQTMLAVTFAADPLQTGSLGRTAQPDLCLPTGCVESRKTAKSSPAAIGVPQN
jgi:hypothetical protein